MSRNSTKKKKSTSKYRKFKISPLISVVAIIEVLVLVAISTYAWFIVAQEKEANTGLITVDADSGLNIDFKNANYDDEINLWDYVPEDFEFSPVTSLDGRNVFVPTSGTFGGNTTNDIRYRDATINDINTKYIDVDFTLTNTNDQPVNVYLNNNSRFRVYDNAKAVSGEAIKNSRALRLAFYTNDAKHGNVGSSILANTNNENAALDALENRVTVYFEKPSHWGTAFAYIWKTENSANYEAVSWPGSAMTRIAGNIYSYTFSNTMEYTSIVFNNGQDKNTVKYSANHSTYTQTDDLTITADYLYQGDGTKKSYSTRTVYFRKPGDWNSVKAHVFVAANNETALTSWPGDDCTNCGADIYSFTFPEKNGNNQTYAKIIFNDGNGHQTDAAGLDTTPISTNPLVYPLYYFTSGGSGTCTRIAYSESTIYFNNTLGWTKPYVKLTSPSGHVTRVPMTNLSAGVYYATIPSAYTQISFEEREGMSDTTTAQTTKNKYTQTVNHQDGYIYRPDVWTNTGYSFTTPFSYTDYVGDGDTYAVISPGVSAGFQRAYTPVVGVADTNGTPLQVVPAFASALDNYIKRSGTQMFRIPANGMLDLSMIIWLEGTDKDCVNANYAAKFIDLYLEFSTTLMSASVDDAEYYTYRFYDKTREVWTSDRLTNEAGVSVAPVIQLYDNTDKRGYLMHASSTTNIGGTRKVDVWECQAPAVLYTGGHDLYFRRVDPYNEDEVWNYWHPITPDSANKTFDGVARQTIGGVSYVNFTAFADGAPAKTAEDGIEGNSTVLTAATAASTPDRSCGGLWGKHETKLFTMIDGTDGSGGYWFTNNSGVMTINYTYNYGGGKTQAIEYKTSGPYYGQIYFAVVPTDISSKKSGDIRFRRFYNFDKDYAMNIYKRNTTMNYDGDNVITPTGTFGYFGYFRKDSDSMESWYGNAINYINISYKDEGQNKDMFGGARYTVEVFNSNTSKNIRLYTNNGKFQLNNFNGYLIVIPNGMTKYQLRHVKSDNWSYVYDYGDEINVTYRNAVIYKWQGGAHNVGGDYNNKHTTYGWPEIPSVWYPD